MTTNSRRDRRAQVEPLEGRQLLAASLVHDFGADITSMVADHGAYVLTGNDQLWHTDGTPDTAVLLSESRANYRVDQVIDSAFPAMATLNGRLFFLRFGALWASDGTAAGTVSLADLPVNITTGSTLASFFPSGDTMYIVLNSGQLWRTDGTPAGTVAVKDLGGQAGTYAPATFASGENGQFFFAFTSGQQRSLWQSDGTPDGTRPLQVLTADTPVPDPTIAGDRLFFVAIDPTTDAAQLWTMPAGGGTATLAWSGNDTYLTDLTPYGQDVLFIPKVAGIDELWRTDATPQGASRILPQSPDGPQPQFIHVADGFVTFTAYTASLRFEPWSTTGQPGSEALLKDISPGEGESWPTHFTDFAGKVYFTAFGADRVYRLWRTDGTPAGTTRVPGVVLPAVNESTPSNPDLVSAGANLFVAAGSKLLRIDNGPDSPEVLQSLGQVGTVNGKKNQTLRNVHDADGSTFSIQLKGPGTGDVLQTDAGLAVNITGATRASTLVITTNRDGDRRTNVHQINLIDGTIGTLQGKATDVSGQISIPGDVKTITLGTLRGARVGVGGSIGTFSAGDVANATIAAAGAIGKLTLNSVTASQIFSGANLGADLALGGSGGDADSFGSGRINAASIRGTFNNSALIAGLDPVDGVLHNGNDAFSNLSQIKAFTAGDLDADSRVIARLLPKRVRIGRAGISPVGDARFVSS